MTPSTVFRGRKVAIVGLGGSGLATARALVAGGADARCWDDGDARDTARAEGLTVEDLREADWAGFAALVLAPGIPLTHPAPHWSVEAARAAGVEVIGDVELFCRERQLRAPGAPFVAVTGTNGKSTTTALVAHLLRAAGNDVAMGGNIGTAVLALEPPANGRFHVVEMSSFQIDLTPSLHPTVGIMLNVTPDHLDRHGSMEHYAAIKERLVQASDTAVVGVDDAISAAMADRREAAGLATVRVTTQGPIEAGFHVDGNAVVFARHGRDTPVANLVGIGTLRGRHNAQNAAAAVAAVLTFGVKGEVVREALPTFGGLAHRLEEVGRRHAADGDILFINDSKATNADSTEKALLSFGRIHWIAGGKPKEGGIESLRPLFPRVARAYLIGEAAEAFANTLGESVPHMLCGTLDKAVAAAAAGALDDDRGERAVVLSPACASYDQFKNFEQRGDRFRDLVRVLPGITTSQTGAH